MKTTKNPKPYNTILRIVQAEVAQRFTPEEDEIIEWETDVIGELKHVCKGSLHGNKFIIRIDRFTGKAEFIWQ